MDLNEILIDGKRIVELIPHKPPMLMLDTLLNLNEKLVKTSFQITNHNLFVYQNHFLEAGIIENMAQSSTLIAGYEYYSLMKKENKKYIPPYGYIGAINHLYIKELPEAGNVINTESEVSVKISGVTVVTSRVFINEKEIARADMKVFMDI